ncbi:helix-turn-helix domain protein [Desulfosporosinus acididurans]|uniref:Helix-turn-helix domain protein n=1 Tax=Desulfosporosinus acididurans TaxID=476652 RepID=A0A0J1FSP9_9FIRM|nr:helix-turn-helix domain-containing protein [Desulfosporosinus acididurans]KLU66499.1 helix-turn-helix domain protein [Desulfosporosinus acididurans]
MTKDEFVKKLDQKLKLVRTEFDYSQDKMAEVLGMSKKTLVQIEKGRSTLGWMGAVTLCTIFGKSEILSITFGGQPKEVIMALAFDSTERDYPKTLGGKIWWEELEASFGYKMQKNLISQHYRILDTQERRICSSFEFDHIKKRFEELTRHGEI